MGLASYPNDGLDADTLLMNADAAMYRAKEMGRNNYQLYTSQINIKVHEKLRLQEQLRHALANEEFRLVYQPQVDLQTRRSLAWKRCCAGITRQKGWSPQSRSFRLRRKPG